MTTPKNQEFNFKDFILEEPPAAENPKIKTPTKTKSNTTYKVEWVSGADFIISKKTLRTTSYMCFIINKKQIYIKKSNGTTEDLNYTNYNRFFKDLNEPLLINASWLTSINSKISVNHYITNIFEKMKNDEFIFAANNKLIHTHTINDLLSKNRFDDNNLPNILERIPFTQNAKRMVIYITNKLDKLKEQNIDEEQLAPIDSFLRLVLVSEQDPNYPYINQGISSDAVKNLLSKDTVQHFYDNSSYTNRFDIPVLELLLPLLGNNNVTKIIDNIADNILNYTAMDDGHANLQDFTDMLININFKPETMSEYISNEYITQKYTFSNFINIYTDVINMQLSIYNKIKEKYPKNLAEMHQELSYMSLVKHKLESMKDRENDNKSLSEQAENLKQYLFSDENYTITTPSSIQEILEEASMQNNCLANYIKKAATGKCYLFFMRYTNTPDLSLITIEVQDNNIVQIKGYYNRNLTEQEKQFVRKWAKAKNLIYNA